MREVEAGRIRVVQDGEGAREAYRTLEEAQRNSLGMSPSPEELAEDIRSGRVTKPVRLRVAEDPTGRYDYDLIGGRVRYWAWVIARGEGHPIPALVRGEQPAESTASKDASA